MMKRIESIDEFLDAAREFLEDRVESEGGDWAEPSPEDERELHRLIHGLIDLKLEKDCDGDRVWRYVLVNRIRHEAFHYRPVPDIPWAGDEDYETKLDDALAGLEMNIGIASDQMERALKSIRYHIKKRSKILNRKHSFLSTMSSLGWWPLRPDDEDEDWNRKDFRHKDLGFELRYDKNSGFYLQTDEDRSPHQVGRPGDVERIMVGFFSDDRFRQHHRREVPEAVVRRELFSWWNSCAKNLPTAYELREIEAPELRVGDTVRCIDASDDGNIRAKDIAEGETYEVRAVESRCYPDGIRRPSVKVHDGGYSAFFPSIRFEKVEE